MTVCLSLFVPIHPLTILSAIAIASGLGMFFFGVRLAAPRRALRATTIANVDSGALQLIEVSGRAAGPYTVTAPISGTPCFLYQTTAWQHQEGSEDEWLKVADETLQLPFFIDDSTGQLLIEPLGADLDLRLDVSDEHDARSFSSNDDDVPPRVAAFLLSHGIAPAHRLRIEERSIKPDDALFVVGAPAENPGIRVRPGSPRGKIGTRESGNHSSIASESTLPDPQVIRLSGDAAPQSAREMSQQSKIAAALTRAGITKPEAWTAAGVPCQTAVAEEISPVPVPAAQRIPELRSQEHASKFDLTPQVVMMRSPDDPTFVISFRSQTASATARKWKSLALASAGAAISLLGVYALLVQRNWR